MRTGQEGGHLTNQEGGSHQEPNCPAPWLWTSQPPELWKLNVCCLSQPVYSMCHSSPNWPRHQTMTQRGFFLSENSNCFQKDCVNTFTRTVFIYLTIGRPCLSPILQIRKLRLGKSKPVSTGAGLAALSAILQRYRPLWLPTHPDVRAGSVLKGGTQVLSQ